MLPGYNKSVKYVSLFLFLVLALVTGCSSDHDRVSASRAQLSASTGAQPIVIDVRTPEEFASGHIQGAVNIPLAELERTIASVVPEKSTPLFVHCQSGGRSARAKATLSKLGYTHVTDLGSLAHALEVVQGK